VYCVLLVDDEENVLEILKSTIQWQELGVEKLLTAQDGLQALDILENRQVDLLITDINMPSMDGITLIRQVKCLYPEVRCILLTAYGEFEYARQAINLGVENYLLKPITKDEVEQTVQKALNNLYGKRQNGESLLRENILQRWAAGVISEEELSERGAMLGLNLYLPEYCVICIVKKNTGSGKGFRTSCTELLAKKLEVYSFWDDKGRFVLIVGGRQLNTEELADQLAALAVEQNVSDLVGVSFGAPVTDVEALHLSYQVACDDVELSDLNQSGVILKNSYESQGFDIDWLVEEIRFLFFCNDEKVRNVDYKHLSYKLWQNAMTQGTDKVLVQLLGICMRVLLTEFPLKNDLQERVYHEGRKLEKGLSGEAFEEEVLGILSHVQGIFTECYNEFSPIVQLAIRYALNGAMEGIGGSVKEFCAQNGMNPAYLGHIYKKETGNFFNDYLNQCRINRSIILLRNPNHKIKDIAERVGFTSTSYFVKCFRENKGVSPTKYRMGIE